MKIAVPVKELIRVLTAVASVIESKVTVPALQYARLSLVDGQSAVTGGDFSTVLTVKGREIVGDNGELLIPARMTLDILANVASDLVTLETENEAIVLRAGKFKSKLTSMPAAQYPKTDPTPATSLVLNVALLNKVISRVEFAVPTGEGKFVNSIMLLESVGKVMRAVGTDGYRIAVAEEAVEGPAFKLLLPRTALGFVSDIASEAVSFAESELNYFFSNEDMQLLIRKSPAQFPPYEKFMSGPPATTTVEMAAEELKFAVNRTLPGADTSVPKALFTYTGTSSELAINAKSEFAESDDSVTVENGKGAAVNILLNLRYVEQFISKASGKLVVTFLGDKRPVLFSQGTEYRYFLMPTKPEEAKKAA